MIVSASLEGFYISDSGFLFEMTQYWAGVPGSSARDDSIFDRSSGRLCEMTQYWTGALDTSEVREGVFISLTAGSSVR